MRLIFAILFMILSSVIALADIELRDPDAGFKEEYQPKTRISGSVIAGMVAFGDTAPDALEVRGFIPRAWAGDPVCLEVVTIGGFYEAENEYQVPANWAGGQDNFAYPSKYADVLLESPAEGLAMKMQRGECESPSDEISLGYWNFDSGATPAVLVNSFQADEVYAYVADKLVPISCAEISLPGKSAFDTVCPLDGLPTGSKTSIEILRVVNGKPTPSELIDVWLP